MELADLLFPDVVLSPADYDSLYPLRTLPQGAMVTRLAPSPTGFIHLGNLYGALVDERLAHQSGGVFFLRIEDTDEKRRVAGAVDTILSSLDYFDVHFDEGATVDGESGAYGPYHQSARAAIYQCFAKLLVARGDAYPCFCTEAELATIRAEQERLQVATGYYGAWAKHRDLPFAEIERRLANHEPFVIRLRSQGVAGETLTVTDAIRGVLTLPVNEQDIVLIKAGGLPTYHFAHVIDDHLMRVTHVIRGEEWLSTLPVHVALFQLLGWDPPIYGHTAHLLKLDGGVKRKLSKRKDPELGLDYYRSLGYHPLAVKVYLMTILNSNYEDWHLANPEAPLTDFIFNPAKMSRSGALFDLNKLNDISKDTLLTLPATAIYSFLLDWVTTYRPELVTLLVDNADAVVRLLDIGRGGTKPRKDLICASQIFDFISYFFDEFFTRRDHWPTQLTANDCRAVLQGYLNSFDILDDSDQWLANLHQLAVENGYAPKKGDYKKNPSHYKGHIGDVSAVLRLALVGRNTSPDLWTLQQVMGETLVRARIGAALDELKG